MGICLLIATVLLVGMERLVRKTRVNGISVVDMAHV